MSTTKPPPRPPRSHLANVPPIRRMAFRPSQFPKAPPRATLPTDAEIVIEVDLSDVDPEFYTRPTPMLPPKP